MITQGVSQIFTGYYYPLISNAGELLLLLGATLLVFLVERDFVLAGSFAGDALTHSLTPIPSPITVSIY